ncbi:hypothetical protein [Bacteroides acidifaciens]|jgi:hypothetical protein|uniref:hypothetical protein n=1 Tax=Bacteroides acidifaciens TaxID=85831 RepID=UPI0025857EB9|nr:hypothetical protein [Bacteroides acidifaciens]
MKAKNQHISFSGRGEAHQTSYHYRIIKGLAKVVAIIIGTLTAIVVWVVVRPVIRGIGWIISIATALLTIYWILTL